MKRALREKKPSSSKLTFKSLLVIAAVAVVGATVLALSFASGPATITLSPTTGSYAINSNFAVTIYENSGADAVNVIQADLNYDQSKLQFVNIDTSTSAFDGQASQSGGNGLVSIARFRTPESTPLTGKQLVAIINFKAVAGTGTSAITFAKSSYLVRSNDNSDIWNGVTTGGTFTLTTPTASGGGSGGNGGGSTSSPPPSSSGGGGSTSTTTTGNRSSGSGSASKTTTKSTTPSPSTTPSSSGTSQDTSPNTSQSAPKAALKTVSTRVTGNKGLGTIWIISFVGILVVSGFGWWGYQYIQRRRFAPHFQSASGDAKAFVGGVTPFPATGTISPTNKVSDTPPLEKPAISTAEPIPAQTKPTVSTPPSAATTPAGQKPATTNQKTPPATPAPQ